MNWLKPKGRAHLFCEGELYQSPDVSLEKTLLAVSLSQCASPKDRVWRKTTGKVRLRSDLPLGALQMGDVIRFQASFRLIGDFKNQGSFPAQLYYQFKGIVALGFLADPSFLTLFPRGVERRWKGWLASRGENLKKKILEGTSEREGGLLVSLLLGQRSLLGVEEVEHFQRAGVSHLLAISGLNVAIVAFLFLVFFHFMAPLPLLSKSEKVVRYFPILVILPVWLYVAIAGFPISAVRAGIMASLVLIALVVYKRLDLLSAWAFAAFLILALSPLSLYQASFQLSFMAVLFLILFFPRWRRWREGWLLAPPLRWLFDSLAISVITLAGVGPILLHHFHELSFMGLLANVVLVPMTTFLVMPPAMLGWLWSGLFGWSAPLLWKGTGYLSGLTLDAVAFFSRHADAGIVHGAFPTWQLFLYFGALFLFLLQPEILKLKWKLAFAPLLMALVFWGGKMPADGKLKVTFVDVGQGDCAVVQLPNGKVWVIDGGGIRSSDWDVGRFVVAPYLWEEGIHQVDALFLSHPHHDHYKGLGYLAEKFHPRILYRNNEEAPESEFSEWEATLKRIHDSGVVPQVVNQTSSPVEEGEVRLDFLMPGAEGVLSHFDPNNNSVVMRLQYREVQFLFVGDLMEEGELLLLETKQNLKSTVLKTGHHGSQTSTTPAFLEAVAPKYAIISVGAYNPYGVPDEPVLNRLVENKIQLFRTDKNGAITMVTDGKEILVKTFVR